MPPQNPSRRRRWMQFSVRTLLIFTALCAIAAWLGSTWNRAQRQKRLVALLTADKDLHEALTNEIVYDFQREHRHRQLPPHVPKLTELRSLRLHHDLETTIPPGKLSLVLDALADAQDAKDHRVFERAKTIWERSAVEVE